MSICIASAIIFAYMINGYVGFVLMAVLLAWRLMIHGKLSEYNVLRCMILSLPFSYIGILGMSMHQIFSWYNILLLLLLFLVSARANGKLLINGYAGAALILILLLLGLNLFWADDMAKHITESIQVMVMLVPLLVFHKYRKRTNLSLQAIHTLIFEYGDICVATSICMLIQYVLYTFLGRQIGIIHFTGGNRTQCYVLFRGASILPIFMGIGLLIYFMQVMQKRLSMVMLFKVMVIFAAMVINSSRSGLLMVIIVAGLICIREIVVRPNIKKLTLTMLGGVVAVYGIKYLLSKRAALSGFLDVNGRFGTWFNGFDIWTASFKNFLIGEGFVGGRWDATSYAKPHNFIIQTVSQCGIIIGIIVMILIIKYLLDNVGNYYIVLPIFIFGAGLLVTDFYANAFATVIFILVDLYSGVIGSNYERNKGLVGDLYEKSRKMGI